MPFFRQIPLAPQDSFVFLPDTPLIRKAAFFVGNNDFHPLFKNRVLQKLAVAVSVFGIHAVNLEIFSCHGLDDGFNTLSKGLLPHQIHFGSGRRLMAGHRGRFVVENHIGDVLARLDGIRNRDHAGMKEGGIPEKNDLLVRDKRIGAGACSAAQTHAGVVVHERRIRLKHEHGEAAGLAMKDEIDRFSFVHPIHIVRVAKILFNLQKEGGGIPVRASGTESGRPDRQLALDVGGGFQNRLFGSQSMAFRLREVKFFPQK